MQRGEEKVAAPSTGFGEKSSFRVGRQITIRVGCQITMRVAWEKIDALEIASSAMSGLPPPSTEQSRVLRHFTDGRDVVVTAVAGAGKSTLLLHACAAFPDEEVLVLAYNAPLAAEMNERLAAAGLTRATAHTFHSLASSAFRFCPDDNTMAEIVEEDAAPRRAVAPAHLLLDEMQDMRDLYYEMLRRVVDLPRTLC